MTRLRNVGRSVGCILLIGVMAGAFLFVVGFVRDRGWVDDETRMERCIDLRLANFRVLAKHGDPDEPTSREDLRTFDYTRDEVRAFCAIGLANDALNYKGGTKRGH